jgi:hypothetical protein
MEMFCVQAALGTAFSYTQTFCLSRKPEHFSSVPKLVTLKNPILHPGSLALPCLSSLNPKLKLENQMKTIVINQHKGLFLTTGFTKDLSRLLRLLNLPSRTAVKSALNQIRNFKNSATTDLARSYDVEREIRERREEIAFKRYMAGGRML